MAAQRSDDTLNMRPTANSGFVPVTRDTSRMMSAMVAALGTRGVEAYTTKITRWLGTRSLNNDTSRTSSVGTSCWIAEMRLGDVDVARVVMTAMARVGSCGNVNDGAAAAAAAEDGAFTPTMRSIAATRSKSSRNFDSISLCVMGALIGATNDAAIRLAHWSEHAYPRFTPSSVTMPFASPVQCGASHIVVGLGFCVRTSFK